MRSLIYTALVFAIASICANAKLKANINGTDFPMKKMEIMCRASCKVPPIHETPYVQNAYDNLNQNMSSKELFESICPTMYKQQKCMSNCRKAFNNADTTEPIDMGAPNKHSALLRKICTSLTEKLSTLDTLTECANKIYPLIVKPEENEKCRKMCCSDPNADAPLYACNRLSIFSGFIGYYSSHEKENNCQLACVIGQAAKHAHNKCSPVLEKMLLFVRQDVQKIYEDIEVPNKDDENRVIQALNNQFNEFQKLEGEKMAFHFELSKAIEAEKSVAEHNAMNAESYKNPHYQPPIKPEDVVQRELNKADVEFPIERRQQLCTISCNIDYQRQQLNLPNDFSSSRAVGFYETGKIERDTTMAYAVFIDGLSSKELYETFCPNYYRHNKCMSNCLEAFNIANATKADAVTTPETVTKKICTGLTEKLSTLDTLTECASKIYPLIAKPEENAKCKKMCCSDPSNTESLYTCGVMFSGFHHNYIDPYYSYGDEDKESMCQLACVIGQAAKHARNDCSPVLEEILLVAGQDMQKLYQFFSKKAEENKRREKEMPKHEKAMKEMNERLYNHKLGEAIKTEDSNY